MTKKTVLKISIMCLKCKTSVMSTVGKLSGIDSMVVDAEKGTLTVIGDVDPVLIVKQLRKKRKAAKIESVGPPKEETKKPDPPKLPLPPCCTTCRPVAYGNIVWHDEPSVCTIL